jgi:Skp family chaperone for outer membrane proteins
MSDKPADAAPTEPQPADAGPRTEPSKPVPIAAATPFKRMPYVPKRKRGWEGISVPLPLQFAIAVILGVLIATAIAAAYVKWNARVTAEANARATQEEIERIARERQEQLEAEQRAAAERQRAAAEEERARVEKLREEQRLAEEARRSQLNDTQRMEEAFAASYRKPPGCADAATLDCANHYIRAKRAFEVQYLRQRAASAP